MLLHTSILCINSLEQLRLMLSKQSVKLLPFFNSVDVLCQSAFVS